MARAERINKRKAPKSEKGKDQKGENGNSAATTG
jgi:hypothetical protein